MTDTFQKRLAHIHGLDVEQTNVFAAPRPSLPQTITEVSREPTFTPAQRRAAADALRTCQSKLRAAGFVDLAEQLDGWMVDIESNRRDPSD